MKKNVIASILAIAAALTFLLGLAGCNRNSTDDMIEDDPGVTGISSGNIHSKTGLEFSKKLNKSNGKYIKMYVENNGTNPVVATINGQSEKTLQPDETGHIYLEVTQNFWGGDRDYKFKVVTGRNGGSVNIHYEITQQGEIT